MQDRITNYLEKELKQLYRSSGKSNSRTRFALAGAGDIGFYKADADRKLRDIPTWFTKELRTRMKQFAVGYEKLLFQGSGNAGQIKGLQTILDGTDIPGYTDVTCLANAQEVTGGSTKSCDITTSTNFAKFMEWLWKKIASIDRPMGLVMNRALYARLWTIARKEQVLSETRDMFGMPIAKYNGIPMVPVLDTTILNTEDDDTSTPNKETTSLYIMSPGEHIAGFKFRI